MGELSKSAQASGQADLKSERLGFATSVFRLGYALYLIDHHDQLDLLLIKRLRSVREFRPAYYETLIAAAFALAGMSIKMAETSGQSDRGPEFWATSSTGKRYAIEAKCKTQWLAAGDPETPEFKAELRQWIRDQLYRCSMKRLKNPVYCLELSLPLDLSEAQWRQIHELVTAAIHEAESITVKGKPAGAAYVIVTNNAHLANDDTVEITSIAILQGFRMENFVVGKELPIDEAMDWHDAHREIMWVLRCMREVEQVPSTFDGMPPEFFESLKEGERALRIGEQVEIAFPDKSSLRGLVRDVCSHGESAHIVLEDSDGQHKIAEIPLSKAEFEAAQKYGDAVFGKAEKKIEKTETPLELYDWFLRTYSDYSKEALLRQISGHPDKDRIAELPIDQLRVRVAREVTKAALSSQR